MLWHWTLDYKPYLTIHSFSALKVLINLTKACLWTVGRSKSTKRKFKKAGKTGKLYAEGHQLGFELGNFFLWDYNTLPTMTVDWLTKLCSVKIRCHSLSKTLATFVSKKAIFFLAELATSLDLILTMCFWLSSLNTLPYLHVTCTLQCFPSLCTFLLHTPSGLWVQ